MARIADGVIERLKESVCVQRLAEARGIGLKRHGADLIGRCPFHDDKMPSLVITPAKNLWHCLGACQAGGTVIDWVMKSEGVSFRHAVELLQNDYSPAAAVLSSSSSPAKRSTVKKLAMPLEREAEDAKLLVQVVDYYHQTLLQTPAALDYLKRRGIHSEEAIRTFKLGLANRTLGYRLPAANRVEGAAIRGRLQRLGLLRESGHEHFNGSLVIPVIDETGEITEIYGRKITAGLRPGTPLHMYLPGPHRGVWNAAALRTSEEVILCESLIDALTFWCAGYRNVTASYGVEGFTADHLALFKQCGSQRMLIAYDRDDAGERAAEKLSKVLISEGLDCYRIVFPKGMDANEYAKVGPSSKSLGVAIRSAQWLGAAQGRANAAEGRTPGAAKGQAKPITTAEAASFVERVPMLASQIKEEALPSLAAAEIPQTAEPSPLPLPSQVVPELPAATPALSIQSIGAEHEHVMTFADRRYRVRGLDKNMSYDVLKVNVLASRPSLDSHGERVHVDTFDLYQARHRAAFVNQAAAELGVAEELIKADLGKLLLALEVEQEKLITAAQPPQASEVVKIDDAERDAALALLKRPDLIERIAADFSRCGIVGETTNALVGYLAALSRKLDRPLALLIQSTSAAGKSSLLDAVLRFVPEEERIAYSAMTGQSLFYMGEMNLKHKILAIAEEEGAHRASYALKLLQSEGELTIASTSKDPQTGKLMTDEYRVEGPVMIALTTTAAEIDEELLNRCLVLSVDEGRAQTQAIHTAQRERRTLAGLQAKVARTQLLKLHQNAQRLLQPLAVVNPYARYLTFLDDRTRTRRDHEKYLTLIDAIVLLHQHQRVLRTAQQGDAVMSYIEATLDDIALANRLAHEVLGRTLDELPPQTRRLLTLIVTMVEAQCATQQLKRSDYRFSRRQVREHTRWGDTQLKIHLARLVELEYLLVHRGGRGQSFEYELLYSGQCDGQHHLSGLIDIEVLRTARDYDGERSGSCGSQSGSGRGEVGTLSADSRSDESLSNADKTSASRESAAAQPKTNGTRRDTSQPSYLHPSSLAAS
jgi:DNA primase catalytic core